MKPVGVGIAEILSSKLAEDLISMVLTQSFKAVSIEIICYVGM
jgi:hypothetical protein